MRNAAQQKAAAILKAKGFTPAKGGTYEFERVVEFTEQYRYRGAPKVRVQYTVDSININEDGTVRGSRRSTAIPDALFTKTDPEEL